MSLPTKEQFEELKMKRKQDLEQKRTMERQVHGTQSPGHPVAVASLLSYPTPLLLNLLFKLASVVA